MPAVYKMSWEPKARRWWKQYKGRRYQVSCRQLNAPETKEASYQAANDWWNRKKSEIDGQQPPHKFADWLDDLSRRRAWATKHGQTEIASELASEIARIEGGGLPEFVPGYAPTMADDPPPPEAYSYSDDEPPLEVTARAILQYQVERALNPFDEVWHERLASENPESVNGDKRIGSLVKVWLSLKQAKVESGDLTPASYDNTIDCLNHFRDWVGTESAVTDIVARRWHEYWLYLSGKVKDKVWSRGHASIPRAAQNETFP